MRCSNTRIFTWLPIVRHYRAAASGRAISLRFARREKRWRERERAGARERRSRPNARADRLRLSRARSLYLKQRTGILCAGIYFRSLAFDACAAAVRSEAGRGEARRGEARRNYPRVQGESQNRKRSCVFLYRPRFCSGCRLNSSLPSRLVRVINHVVALLLCVQPRLVSNFYF